MTEELCTVRVGEETRRYAKRTTYREIAADFQHQYPHDIVLVFVNHYRLQELEKQLKGDCTLEFLTTADPIGYSTYKRSMSSVRGFIVR